MVLYATWVTCTGEIPVYADDLKLIAPMCYSFYMVHLKVGVLHGEWCVLTLERG